MVPAYLHSVGNLFDLTPWYPGWFAGMPVYTYYFVLPDILAYLGSYIIGFARAFKLATVLGSVLMPGHRLHDGRLFKAPRPIPRPWRWPRCPSSSTPPSPSTAATSSPPMAGEYAFSLSLARPLTIGLFARGMRTGRGYWLAAMALSVDARGPRSALALHHRARRRHRGSTSSSSAWAIGDPHEPRRTGIGAPRCASPSAPDTYRLASRRGGSSLRHDPEYTNSMGYTNDPTSTAARNLHDARLVQRRAAARRATAGYIVRRSSPDRRLLVRDRLGMILAR